MSENIGSRILKEHEINHEQIFPYLDELVGEQNLIWIRTKGGMRELRLTKIDDEVIGIRLFTAGYNRDKKVFAEEFPEVLGWAKLPENGVRWQLPEKVLGPILKIDDLNRILEVQRKSLQGIEKNGELVSQHDYIFYKIKSSENVFLEEILSKYFAGADLDDVSVTSGIP